MTKLTDQQRTQIDNLYQIGKGKRMATMDFSATTIVDASEVPDFLLPPGEDFGETVKTADIVGEPIRLTSVRTFEVNDPKEPNGKRLSVVCTYLPLSGADDTGEEKNVYMPTKLLSRLENFFKGSRDRALDCRIFKDPEYQGVKYRGYQLFGLDMIPEDGINRKLAQGV